MEEKNNKEELGSTSLGSNPEELEEKVIQAAKDEIVSKIGLWDFYDEEIRNMLARFGKMHNEKMPDEQIDFRLNFWKKRGKGGLIATVGLRLELKLDGLWSIMINKTHNFKHVKELRQESVWKTGLYREVWYELTASGIYLMLMHQKEKNRH